MSEVLERIRGVLRGPQLASLATINADGKPWTRYMVVMADNDLNLRSATFVGSRKTAQVKANPEVHITCGVTSLAEMKPYLQIQGRATVTTDENERKSFWTDEFKAYFTGPDDPNYAVLVVKPYRIEYLAVGAMQPEVWQA